MDVGALLRQAREQAGLGQAELAQRAGVDQSVLCRFEKGARRPSLRMLDRLLAVCGVELAGQLVPRRDELAEQLDRLAGRTPHQRLSVEELPCLLLDGLLRHGCDLLVGGVWAARALGLPVSAPLEGRLLLDPAEVPSFVAAVTSGYRSMQPRRWVDGEPAHWRITEDLFVPGGELRWSQRLVGDYRTVVLQEGQLRPPEERVLMEDGPMRVVAAVALTPEDGVPAQLRDAFLAWRESRAA